MDGFLVGQDLPVQGGELLLAVLDLVLDHEKCDAEAGGDEEPDDCYAAHHAASCPVQAGASVR